jgi:DNA-binding CsgD family transcriptional regulator
LHPERAEKYDYCTRRECRERNAKPLTIVTVGVNKAADQYLVLNDRTRQDLAAGRYQDQRKSASVTDERPPADRVPAPAPAAPRPARRPPAARKPAAAWSRSQQDLALLYNAQGMRPDEIADKLGLSRHTVTQMILAARHPVKP